jgi:hypothetical protein
VRGAAAAAALALAAAAGGVAACGGSGNDAATTAVQAPARTGAVPTTTTEQPGASVEQDETLTTPPPTATTGTPPPEQPKTTSTGESGQGGAGDEEAIRTPVALTARDGALSPTTVTIPAFLALTVTVTSSGPAETVTIDAPGGGTLSVPAGGRAAKSLTGLRPGDYPVTTRSGGKTVLHVVNGGDPGP